ncbi:unnamed protein product [Haemonchus placei]|uniref:STAS domain-containing protein n=1 Tax=Haemonchus placei TaxID=6290 RepID=A0A0N4WPA6_HAEPC|nr:unnamed protein product [Haemonchus placei]
MPKLLSKAVPIGAKCRDGVARLRQRLFRRRNFSRITSFLPILTWLPHYDWSHSFFGDLSGGLTMAVFSVPQGIALAGITGVPPVYGLYTAIFPSFLYIFFGTSKHNALGGFAVLSLMTHTAIEKVMMKTAISYNTTSYVNHTVEEIDLTLDGLNGTTVLGNGTSLIEEITTEMWTDGVSPVKEIHVATTIIFFAGCIQVLMGVFRLQYLTTVFSEQVMSGFVVGGGVHVFFAQIGDVLGMKLPRRSGPGYLYYRICDLIENIGNIHYPTLAISLSSLTFLIFGKEFISPWLSTAFHFPIPFDLVLAVVGITATNYAELSRRFHIKVLGNIPTEFPPPSLPRFDLIQYIGVNAVAIALTAVAIHLTVAKIVEKRYKYKINHGQELYALGFVGVLSSFFPVFPVTSGFARSVVGAAVGSSTQLTCLFSSLALVLVILYIGPALEYLPKCILSTMIIVSQRAMFAKFAELRELWPVFKVDFTIWLMSMILTVCFDMGEGLLLATGFAVLTTIIRMQRPKWHFLSRDSDSDSFKETKKKHLEFVGGNVCVFRMDAPLIFTSIDRFTTAVWQSVKTFERSKAESFVTIDQMNSANTDDIFEKKARAAYKGIANEDRCRLVIDCSGFPYVDYLGLTTLKTVVADLIAANIQTYLVVQKGDLRKLFEVTDFYETVERERIFEKLDQAVKQAEER